MIDASLIQRIEVYLKDHFEEDSYRFRHIYQMKQVAITLGELYQEEITNVIVASYLHDATKYMSLEENIAYASKILTKPVLPACAHAYAAKRLAQEVFGIEQEDILNAIQYHCSGRKAMSLLEKIIYLSDYIEESRTFVKEELRQLAKVDLDKAVLTAMIEIKEYLEDTNQPVSNLTIEAITYYQKELEESNG